MSARGILEFAVERCGEFHPDEPNKPCARCVLIAQRIAVRIDAILAKSRPAVS